MSSAKIERRLVPADPVEATPNKYGNWLLAAPLLVFVGWVWVDLFALYSPAPWYWLSAVLGTGIYLIAIVLPLGWLAHRLVTAAPWLFQNAGWDVQPLEPVREAEQYIVRYQLRQRYRASTNWSRTWLRVGQGWVYIEISVILVGGVLMIPLFFSALDFGFGR